MKKEKNSNQILYLRGIQFTEMQSIMQFIYLGEATFYEERMDEVLAVAKSLEIKELCNAETETNYDPEDGPSTTEPSTFNKNLKEEMIASNHNTKKPPQERRREVVSLNGKFECESCHKTFSSKGALYNHKQSIHEGVKYACDQCDYQATTKGDLKIHIQSMHEGIKYACDQCDHQATTQGNLKVHIQSKHEGVKYVCDQCNRQFADKSSLRKHIKSKHEGLTS